MKMRKCLFILFLGLFVLADVNVCLAKKLVVVAWDAAGLNNVSRLLKKGKLPHLKSLLDSGGNLVKLETIGRTGSLSSYAHVFTGLSYEQSGVLGNRNLNRKYNGAIDQSYDERSFQFEGTNIWIRELPYSHTIIKAIQDRGQKIGWFVSSGFISDSGASPLAQIAKNADSYFMTAPWITGDDYLKILTSKAVNFLNNKHSSGFLVFLHTCPDWYGHKNGENSQRYEEEIIKSDVALGRILKVIDKDTKVLVFADHGFEENSHLHKNAPDVWMVTDLPIREKYYSDGGTLRDIANTILQWYGIDDKARIPQMRGKSLLKPQQ